MNSPRIITTLGPNDVFVFGSNLAGIHGAGAAKQALRWGAVRGVGEGLMGRTYALPTKDARLVTLPLPRIAERIATFLLVAASYRHRRFLVTAIGCGLAGYQPHQIAPLFGQRPPENVLLPEVFNL